MALSLKVAIMRGQKKHNIFYISYGINIYDLTYDELLDRISNNSALLSEHGLQYVLDGSGRSYPVVSREEIAVVLNDMDVLMIEIEPETYIYGDMGQMLFHQIMSDNLLDSCKYFIINIIGDLKLSTQAKPTAVDIIKSYGFNIEDYKRKPYIVTETVLKNYKANNQKSRKFNTNAFAKLKSELIREEAKMVLAQPIKETLTAGKTFASACQRLGKWITSIGKSN